jgi:high-affinity iron transporter
MPWKMTYKDAPISTVILITFFSTALSSLLISYHFSHAQQAPLNDPDILVLMVNLERMRAQISLTQDSLDNGDIEMAFAHAYIPHSVTFPSIKKILEEVSPEPAKRLETLLTDLPINIRAKNGSYVELGNDLQAINTLLGDVLNQVIGSNQTDKGITLQTITYLLKDAGKSYVMSNSSQSTSEQQLQDTDYKSYTVDYENALGLFNVSSANYAKVAGLIDERRKLELDSFFNEIQKSMVQKADQNSVLNLISAVERDINEELSLSNGNATAASENEKYLSEIRRLLSSVITEVRDNGDYETADSYAVKAYLDNYEYLEAPLERVDAKLMAEIETEMREELRSMLAEKENPTRITIFVNTIAVKLNTAEALLERDPSADANNTLTNMSSQQPAANVESLSRGFGVYSGERKDIGAAEDPAKAAVRSDIDEIRSKLDQMLRLYKEGNYEGALLMSRSAYLDSYENVEIPLRPINPDFTLEMEIKFAELRNLIQTKSTYDNVADKAIEIRRGLDESERLVSGTGILAPTIAFSTSFSIIFREGLESALIIGAIVTYLEASRTQRFKKHVYMGILMAAAATGVTWFVAEYIIEISGASRELIEAIAGISAVAVLFWVSFWVLNRIETKKWIEFVKAKVWQATTTGSVMVFFMLSFFTVYREGFETVLFYKAMLSFAKYMEWYVAAGLILGLAVIIGVALVVRKLGKKLPLRVLFGLTMGIGAYMSIAFMGNAVREFQELGYIPTTPLLSVIPRLDINLATMTGIHPTLETVVAQLILLSIYIVGSLYVLVLQPRRKKAIESSRKSMADLKKREKEQR